MKTKLMAGAALSAMLVSSAAAQESDLNIVFAEDRSDHSTFDPRVTQSRHEEQVIVQVFDQLIAADSEGNFYPGLAKSWTVSDDGLSYTFELRDDVTFHDGTPFNADAVKFTFDTIVDPKTGSQGAVDIIGPYESTDVLGPYQVRVNYQRPYGAALGAFSETELSIVSPSAVEEKGATGFAQSPVGTGPFKFVEWEQGKQITLVRNDDYNWAPEFMNHQGPSEVAEAIVRFVPDASTRVAALEAGEIDIIELAPPLDMRRFADSDEFGTMAGNVAGLPFAAMFNTTRGPFQDIRVRKAFMHAIDRPRLAENLFFGFADAAWGPLSETTPAYWEGIEEYYPYDPERAAQLLEEAGWTDGSGSVRTKDGQPLRVYFPALLEPETAVALQAEAAKIGFDVNVENVMKARQDELILNNEYDMLVIRWVSNDPGVLIIPFHSRNIPEPGQFKFNWARYSSPELDQMLEDAASAGTEEERDRLYADIQKLIMDEAIFLPIHNQVQLVAYDADLEGLRFAPGNWQVKFYDIERAE